jgi:hypothetical protein
LLGRKYRVGFSRGFVFRRVELFPLELKGREETAWKSLREAADAFSRAEFKLYAAATNRQLGRLLGSDKGRELIEKADRTTREEGVVRPDRIAAMLVPGFPD